MKEALIVRDGDKLNEFFWKAAINAERMREEDLREMIDDPTDTEKHRRMLVESLRAKHAREN